MTRTLKTLCPLPWNHFSVFLDANMRICCNTHDTGRLKDENGHYIPLKNITNLNDYFNNDHLKKIRKQMLAGERPIECSNCYSIEDHGGKSVRQLHLERFSDDLQFISQLKKTTNEGEISSRVTYMDFSLGNKCNIRCVMCNPVSSSILKSEFEALGWGYDKDVFLGAETGWNDEETLFKAINLCINDVNEMLFTGGEPFLSNLHLKILQELVDRKIASRVKLVYHSNCTQLPDKLLTLWKHFKEIHLHASVEGYGEHNDYIRYGSDFKTIEKNIITVADLPNAYVGIYNCFDNLSIFGLPRFYEWVHGLHPNVEPYAHHIWISSPAWLEASHLPQKLKSLATEKVLHSIHHIKNEAFTNQVKSLLSKMNSTQGSPELWREFQRKISELEIKRGNSLKSIVPELFS